MKKLRDVRHEDIPEINNPKIRFPVLEGDKIMPISFMHDFISTFKVIQEITVIFFMDQELSYLCYS
jgi:hypothetical protein